MLRSIHIRNYKSILDHQISLGRINVFIGENGSGKSNLLEAVAMASAAVDGRLDAEELYSKGIRIAKPSITFSSFTGTAPQPEISLECALDAEVEGEPAAVRFALSSPRPGDIHTPWESHIDLLSSARTQFDRTPDSLAEVFATYGEEAKRLFWPSRRLFDEQLEDFAIYNLNILALRGMHTFSRKTPLGVNGENLDVLIASFDEARRRKLVEGARVVTWFDDLEVDERDERKLRGYKLGRSTSTLYFRDRFMRAEENVFSAENANEGILHILFYLALFVSDKTPRIFGIDNIETGLNPQLCRDLTKELASLARDNDKQALITTHNPAVLDGLNLHDDEQRLFVVYRDDDGHTATRRIQVKPEPEGQKLKLSELWMRGHLGALPRSF